MLTESDEKKQILYDFTRIWNLKKKKKEQTKTHRERNDQQFPEGEGVEVDKRVKGSTVAMNGSDLCWGSLCSERSNEQECCTLKTYIKKKKKGQRTQIDISPKRTYKWPTCA